jgi:hypothetical protein
MRRLTLLLLLVPLAAACGGGGHKSSSTTTAGVSPVAFVKGAAHKTAQAPSEHITLQGTTKVSGQAIGLSGQGDFDNAKKLGSVHATFTAGGLNGAIDEVVSGTTIYLKSPLFSAALPAGKTWLKLDLQKFGQSQGIDLSALTSQNPADALDQLARTGSVTEVGDETIKGADTTHYRAHIDPAKVPQGKKLQALANAKYGPVDIWIGKDDGYVHRMRTSYSVKPTGTAAAQSVAFTMDFSDFGKMVDVSLPPASSTVDATKAAIGGVGK